jgi:hypothetical protein
VEFTKKTDKRMRRYDKAYGERTVREGEEKGKEKREQNRRAARYAIEK